MHYFAVRYVLCEYPADIIVLPTNRQLKEGNGTSKSLFENAGWRKLIMSVFRGVSVSNFEKR